MIDDSALLHYAEGYDPVKAREYYLRTRQLKGGRPRLAQLTPEQVAAQQKARKERKQAAKEAFEKAATGNEGTYDRPPTPKEQREKLEAQKQALIARLGRLQDVLDKLVEAAKARSGIEVKSDPSDSPADKASRNESAKKNTPLTESQKREKAAKAREEYKKENGGPSLSTEVQRLQRQVADVRKKIETAMAEAKRKSSGPQNQTASEGR